MAGDEVGVEVSEEDVANPEVELLGVGQVVLDVALGVDDDGGRGGFVADQIRSVSKAAQVKLLEGHRANCRTRNGDDDVFGGVIS